PQCTGTKFLPLEWRSFRSQPAWWREESRGVHCNGRAVRRPKSHSEKSWKFATLPGNLAAAPKNPEIDSGTMRPDLARAQLHHLSLRQERRSSASVPTSVLPQCLLD